MSAETNLYPSGSIEYTFKMYTTYDQPISCSVQHANVREVVLEKLNNADEFDPSWQLTINTGPVQSVDEVDEIGNSIKEEIFDVLAFTLNTSISEITQNRPMLSPRPGEGGILQCSLPGIVMNATVLVGCHKMSNDSVQQVQSALSKVSGEQLYPLISLFRHAIGIEEAVLRFLMLYLILYDLCGSQKKVDNRIKGVAPDTPETGYTYINDKGKPETKTETVYTRLRNEVNHRPNVRPEISRNEIINNLDRFRDIVYKVLMSETLKSTIMRRTE